MPPVAVALLLFGTIDRIEGQWAVVEWLPSGEMHDVAMGVCPQHIQEGDRIQLHAWTDPTGPAMLSPAQLGQRLLTPHGAIGLPSDAPLPSQQRFSVRIARVDVTPQSPGRTHPSTGTREHGSMDLRLFRVGASATHQTLSRGCTEPADQTPGHHAADQTRPPHVPEPPPSPGAHPPLVPGRATIHSER